MAAGNLFVEFCERTARRSPVYWDEVMPAVLRACVDELAGRGRWQVPGHAPRRGKHRGDRLTGRTIRLYINPVRLASRYMEQLWTRPHTSG